MKGSAVPDERHTMNHVYQSWFRAVLTKDSLCHNTDGVQNLEQKCDFCNQAVTCFFFVKVKSYSV